MRILIVEDDRRLAEEIAVSVEAAGFSVDICRNGEDAWFLGDTEDFAAILLDLGLPKLDGLTVLRRWRANGRHMPVLIVTGRDGWSARVEGLNAGADDYVAKPFKMEELLARLQAVLRRAHGHATPTLNAGGLTLDTNQMRVMIYGRAVTLTPLEYRLVQYLVYHQGRVIPGSELRVHVYGDDDARDANAIEALITRLRRKIGSESIETRRGHGYLIPGDVVESNTTVF